MWEAVWTSSVLILAVAAVRLLFRQRPGQRMKYVLWAVVALRLLLPFPLAPSGFSVMNAVEAAGTAVRAEDAGGSPADRIAASGKKTGVTGGNETAVGGGDTGVASRAEPAGMSAEAPAPGAGFQPGLVWGRAGPWKVLWLAGAVVTAALLTASTLRFSRRLKRRAVPVEREDFPLPVYRAEGLPSPCLYGLFRPAVYLTPESFATPLRLRHILTHEYTHYRHGDHIWSLVRGVCLTLYWFDPLVWLAAELSRRDGELACDEGTLKRLGESERLGYGRTLVELINGKGGGFLCGATTMTSAGKSMKERLEFILKKPRRAVSAVCAALLIVLLAAGCTFTGAAPAREEEGSVLAIDREKSSLTCALSGEESVVLELRDVPVVTEDGQPWPLSGINLDDRVRVGFDRAGKPERVTWVANPLSMREKPDLEAEEAGGLVRDLLGEEGGLEAVLLEGESRREQGRLEKEEAERCAALLEKYRWYRISSPDMVPPDYKVELACPEDGRKLVFYGYRDADGLVVCAQGDGREDWYCARRAVDTVPPSAAQALWEELDEGAPSKSPGEGGVQPGVPRLEIDGTLDAAGAVESFLESRVQSILALDPADAYAAADARWVWCSLEGRRENLVEFTYQLAVKPRNPVRYPWVGRMREGTGEYEGYAVCGYRATLERKDGLWQHAGRALKTEVPRTTTDQLTRDEASALFRELWDRGGDPDFRVAMADGTEYSHSVDSWYAADGQLGGLAAFYQWIPEESFDEPEGGEYTVGLSSRDGGMSLTLYQGSLTAQLERDGEKSWYTLLPCQENFIVWPCWQMLRGMFDHTVPYPVTEVSLSVKQGEDFRDTVNRFLQEVFQHWNDRRAPGDINAIEDFLIVESGIEDEMVREDAFVGTGVYSLKPVDLQRNELWIAGGQDDPDRPGWIRNGLEFRLEQEDGWWRCTSYGGGVSLD